MIEELYPDGMQEQELAERIVGLYWRLRRLLGAFLATIREMKPKGGSR